ncbi:unnamed protein product, partial [Allacma fusca]
HRSSQNKLKSTFFMKIWHYDPLRSS